MKTNLDDSGNREIICSDCKAGVMHLQYRTYYTWLDDELITVPGFPAWVCDMCSRCEYDPRAINWLSTLLNPTTGQKSQHRRKIRMPGIDQPRP